MTPARNIAITVRQTADQTARISSWLGQKASSLGCGHAMLGDALASLSGELDALQSAIERPPAIAVVSASGAGQASLVAGFIEQSQRGTDGERRQIGQSAHALLTGGAAGSGGAITAIRFSSATVAPAPESMPFAVNLLGLADLAAVMVRTHFTSATATDVAEATPRRARIEEIFAEITPKLAVAPAPGLKRRDVQELRECGATIRMRLGRQSG